MPYSPSLCAKSLYGWKKDSQYILQGMTVNWWQLGLVLAALRSSTKLLYTGPG